MARTLATVLLATALGIQWGAGAQAQAGEPATAQTTEQSDDARARQLYRDGDRHYAEADYEQAVTAFQQAYALSRRPLLLFNLANAYERTGRLEEAAEALRQYMPHAPQSERESIKKRIEHLQRKAQPGTAVGAGAVTGVGAAASAQAPAQAGAHGNAQAPDAATVPGGKDGAASATQATTAQGTSTLRTAGWVLTITGGAVLTAGAIAAAVALAARGQANEHCIDSICREEGQAALERDQAASEVADVAFIAGGALAVTGVVLLLIPEASETAEHVQLRVGPDSVGANLHGSF